MARPPAVAGGRRTQVAIRLSDAEVAALDALRGGLTRADWFRSKLDAPMRRAPLTLAAPVNATPAPTMSQTAPGPIRTTASRIMDVVDHKPNAAGTICTVCGWRMSKAPQSCPGKDG